MKRVGNPCSPSANPLSFIRSFFPLFRPSVLSPTLFPALIHEDSVLYNLILQSRAVVKATDFTSRLDAHLYVARAHKTRTRRKYVDFAISVTRLTAFYPNGKISLPYKETDEKSSGKIAHFLQNVHIEKRRDSQAYISYVYKFERIYNLSYKILRVRR